MNANNNANKHQGNEQRARQMNRGAMNPIQRRQMNSGDNNMRMAMWQHPTERDNNNKECNDGMAPFSLQTQDDGVIFLSFPYYFIFIG